MLANLRKKLAGSDSESNADGDDRSRPDHETRQQLLQRIQALLEKNERCNLRFRDVVGAYKSVLKEKEALQATVDALTATTNVPVDGIDATDDAANDDSKSGADDEVEDGANNNNESFSVEQAEVLKKALRSITEEKKTIEKRFKNDKKAVADEHRAALRTLKTEHEAQLQRLQEELDEKVREKRSADRQIEQLTQQMRTNMEAQEEKDAAWNRERKLHQDELASVIKRRMEAEKFKDREAALQGKLKLARQAELDALSQLSSGTTRLRERVTELEEELAKTNSELAAAQRVGDSEEVLRLRQGLRDARSLVESSRKAAAEAAQKQADVTREAQRRVEEAENRLSNLVKQQEQHDDMGARERMVFESRQSELSALVGRYEQARLDDAKTISALRDQNADLLNELRTKKINSSNNDSPAADDTNVAALQEKVSKLKSLLWMSNQRLTEAKSSAADLSLEEFTELPEPSTRLVHPNQDPDAELEMNEMATEIETYYNKAKACLRARDDALRKVSVTEAERSSLQEQLVALRSQNEKTIAEARQKWEADHLEAQQRLQTKLDEANEIQRKTLEVMKKRHQTSRDRTIALLADREAEIERLRVLAGLSSTPSSEPQLRSSSTKNNVAVSSDEGNSSSDSHAQHGHNGKRGAATPLTPGRKVMTGLSMSNGGTGGSLHFQSLEVQQSEERSFLRQRIRELEELNDDAQEQCLLQKEQMGALKEEIRRLERNAKREGANLEYLKNVLVKYMENSVSRARTIPAIATILQFSPEELRRVNQQQQTSGLSWWPKSP